MKDLRLKLGSNEYGAMGPVPWWMWVATVSVIMALGVVGFILFGTFGGH